jgi:2,4-dienoyl-CoA reductase-like NADH-dependent reductase (Old Yellow Enzyme family)
MGSGIPNERGFATDRTIPYYHPRARGGMGMIIVEASLVARGKSVIRAGASALRLQLVPGLQSLVRAVKSEGAPAWIQPRHPGRQTNLSEPVAAGGG